jgi:tRNA(fMet)-specific endonuclease VapC
MTYFLDTNTCIYFLKNAFPAVCERLHTVGPANTRIPAMVKAELLYGVEKSAHRQANNERVQAFLSAFEVVPFCSLCAEAYAVTRAVLERKGTPIGPADLVIASTVLAHDGTLATDNLSEFRRVPGLRVENWART